MKSTISLEKETIGKLAVRGKKGDTFEQIISDLFKQNGWAIMKLFLTAAKKLAYLPFIVKRQNGLKCYFCGKPFKDTGYVFEHLNDDEFDNRIENIGICCQSCNVKKIKDFDMKFFAQDMLKSNEKQGISLEENVFDIQVTSNEIKINRTLRPFCKQYVIEHVSVDGKISLHDTALELVYLSQEKFGFGAESTIRKYLAELTCKVAPFMIIKEGKQQFIVKRTGN